MELNQRQDKMYWKVLRGFNATGTFNKELHEILIYYARIRLGMTPLDGDELKAASKAVQLYLAEHFPPTGRRRPARRRRLNNAAPPSELWTLIGVIMLNQHMTNFGMTAISFSTVQARDHDAYNQRASHNRTITINGVDAIIENRPNVQTELIDVGRQRGVPRADLALQNHEPAHESDPRRRSLL